MPLIPEKSVSEKEGSYNLTGQMSTARGSTELRPPPNFTLGPEHWIELHETIREKLWQAYRLAHPTTIAEAEESTRVVEDAISRAREELAETAREVLVEEARSEQEFGPTFHQDWPRQPLKAARAEVSAWVGSTPERRSVQEPRWTPQPWDIITKFIDRFNTLSGWKFHSLRELGSAQYQEQIDPPAQRAIAELGRLVENDLSWRRSFPGMVDIEAAMLKDLWDHMESFSQGLHQAVWDVLQNLARATPGNPPRKFWSGGETNDEQQINENMTLLDLEDQSSSDRASVIDPTQELRTDRPISSRTARMLQTTETNPYGKLDREMEMKYMQLPTKKLWKIRPALPLQEDDQGRGFVEFMMSLDQTLQDILNLDPRSTSQALSWAPGWHVPLRKCLWDSVNPRSFRSPSLNAMLNSCMEQVEGAMDAGSPGEEAYRLLVSELKRELDTRVCGAALQKLIVFRVGEGVPFSDCYRSFRTVVHDAKSDGQFAANFNIVQSIVSVLMSQQYPTLYEINFPRNTPNRYFLDEAQMWKALDLLKRNVTRSLPPRSDTGARGSSVGGAPGVGSGSAKIASKASADWVPESIMNVKKDIFKADFPSWPASIETWGAVYNIRNDREPPLLARFSDSKTKPATFREFVGQCLNCLSDDGHNMRTCPKPFLNKSGLMNSKIGELPESEKEAVSRKNQNRLKRKFQHKPKSHSVGNAQRSRRNADRSEVTVTTDQTK